MHDISCAFTGHRPARFSFGNNENDERCVKLKAVLKEQIAALADAGIRMFYSGMAIGVDQWAAEIVLDLKRRRKDLYLAAILPCETQADRWSEKSRERYFNLLAECDDVKTLNHRYTDTCMKERDRFMVDCAGYLLAVFDGNNKGGTAYTIGYAKEKERSIITIHPDTLAVVYPPGFVVPAPGAKVVPLSPNKKET